MWNGKKANFAPRVGLVWNPHGDGRDTIRIGGAILYDTVETWFNERETTNAPIGTNIDTPNPVGGFSNPWQGYPGGNPFPQNGKAFFPTAGVYVNMPINPKPTYVGQWNVTYQRQIGTWMASASYLGNKSTHIWSGNGEQNPAVFLGLGACTINGVKYSTCSTTSNTNKRRILYLANPALGASYASINTADDGAVAHYNGMLLSLQHRYSHGFTFGMNYTYSNCISDTDFGAALATPANSQPFNRHADWGPCVFDTRHNFNISSTAMSSVKGGNPWMNRLLSRWQVAPLFHAASGQPLGTTVGKDNSLTGLGQDRPVQVLSNPYPASESCSFAPCVQWLNPAAFQPNALGGYGTLGRNALRGPGYVGFDVAVSRIFQFTERYALQARVEAFNVLNHANFVGGISPAGQAGVTTMNTTLSSTTYGQVQAAFDPRILQFALKFSF
jgi:hypothetical protein